MKPLMNLNTCLASLGSSLAVLLMACSDASTPEPAGRTTTATGASIPLIGTPAPENSPPANAAAAALAVATVTFAATPLSASDLGLILPDLETVDSDDIYISVSGEGVRLLHFSTEVHNTGEGPMELMGMEDEETGEIAASQIIETRGAGQVERTVGRLQRNDEHGHWHLDDFAVYELWSHTDDGTLETMLATSGKVTFCLIDEFPLDPDDPEVPAPVYGPCDPHAQGISSGWGETYEAWLPGQALDITGLPDGAYALRMTLDPDNLLLESGEANNARVMYLTIAGQEVELTGPPS